MLLLRRFNDLGFFFINRFDPTLVPVPVRPDV